jgi:hypothetical protein
MVALMIFDNSWYLPITTTVLPYIPFSKRVIETPPVHIPLHSVAPPNPSTTHTTSHIRLNEHARSYSDRIGADVEEDDIWLVVNVCWDFATLEELSA